MNSAFEINPFVFKSGKQIISYKMYPIGETREYEKNYTTLIDNSKFELELTSYDLKNENDDNINYMRYSTPIIETKVTPEYSIYKFAGAGKNYYEGSFDIDVDIPYELHIPFENAQDLRKMGRSPHYNVNVINYRTYFKFGFAPKEILMSHVKI